MKVKPMTVERIEQDFEQCILLFQAALNNHRSRDADATTTNFMSALRIVHELERDLMIYGENVLNSETQPND